MSTEKEASTFGQATHTLFLIGQQEPTMEQMLILHDGYLTDLIKAIQAGTIPQREEFRKSLGLGPLEFKIVVDYGQTFEEMVAAGQYDWSNPDITAARFPLRGTGKRPLNAQLIHFNRAISSDDAEKELDKMGLRPGTSDELLAFGATFPDVQRQFPIVELGSVAEIGSYRHVLCLDRDGAERYLRLDDRDYGWDEACRFLAFPK